MNREKNNLSDMSSSVIGLYDSTLVYYFPSIPEMKVIHLFIPIYPIVSARGRILGMPFIWLNPP